jgi:hypothetical protein
MANIQDIRFTVEPQVSEEGSLCLDNEKRTAAKKNSIIIDIIKKETVQASVGENYIGNLNALLEEIVDLIMSHFKVEPQSLKIGFESEESSVTITRKKKAISKNQENTPTDTQNFSKIYSSMKDFFHKPNTTTDVRRIARIDEKEEVDQKGFMQNSKYDFQPIKKFNDFTNSNYSEEGLSDNVLQRANNKLEFCKLIEEKTPNLFKKYDHFTAKYAVVFDPGPDNKNGILIINHQKTSITQNQAEFLLTMSKQLMTQWFGRKETDRGWVSYDEFRANVSSWKKRIDKGGEVSDQTVIKAIRNLSNKIFQSLRLSSEKSDHLIENGSKWGWPNSYRLLVHPDCIESEVLEYFNLKGVPKE